MTLAIFDLDNTLLNGDSDHSWGEFLIKEGLVDAAEHQRENDRFYKDYCNGDLDIDAYLRFVLTPLTSFSAAELAELHKKFMSDFIEPMMLPKAIELVESHRRQSHTLLVITATNRFITEPIVHRFGITELLASEGEIIEGRYTGNPTGTPCFAGGKVTRLKQWLEQHQGETLEGAYFYSDSHNDIPLLSAVDNPVAVDPDDTLKEYANANDWRVMSLR